MQIGNNDIKNPLEVIECQIAFSSKDWSVDKRDRLIYAIVFGWDDIVLKKEFGWDKEFIKEVKSLHEKWENLKRFGDDIFENSKKENSSSIFSRCKRKEKEF